MKSVIQRVARASVSVGGEKVAAIGRGLMILLCAVETDSEAEAEKLARKIAGMRIFPDAGGGHVSDPPAQNLLVVYHHSNTNLSCCSSRFSKIR